MAYDKNGNYLKTLIQNRSFNMEFNVLENSIIISDGRTVSLYAVSYTHLLRFRCFYNISASHRKYDRTQPQMCIRDSSSLARYCVKSRNTVKCGVLFICLQVYQNLQHNKPITPHFLYINESLSRS